LFLSSAYTPVALADWQSVAPADAVSGLAAWRLPVLAEILIPALTRR